MKRKCTGTWRGDNVLKKYLHLMREKKWLFIVLAITFVRIVYIVAFGEIEKEYYTRKGIDLSGATKIPCENIVQYFESDEKYLKRLEIYFDDIPADMAGRVILKIQAGEELVYQAYLSMPNITNQSWKSIDVNCPLKEGQVYNVSLIADQCSSVPSVYLIGDDVSASEIIQSESNGMPLEGNIAVNYGYFRFPTLFDRILSASIWVIAFVAFIVLLYKYELIYNHLKDDIERKASDKHKGLVVCISELILALILISNSGIEFAEDTKVILYIISLLSAVHYEKKTQYIRMLTDTSWKRVLIYVLYLYAAFALVGNRIFVYPFSMNVSVTGIIVFGIAVLWLAPIINTLIYFMDFAYKKMFVQGDEKAKYSFKQIGILLIFLLGPAAINLYANNPGITSWDTWFCMIDNTRNIYEMNSWHPPIYCLLLKMILNIWNSTYAVILFQYLFWIYVILEFMLFLKRKGCKDIWLLSIAFWSGFNVSNFILINSIWKDIPYTLSLLWSMIIITKLTFDFETYKNKLYIYLELILALSGVFLYRNNGIVCWVIIVISIFMVTALRTNLRIWVAILCSLVIILFVKYPLYSYLHVDNTDVKTGRYIGLGQDILGVYFSGGEVSQETLQMVNVMTGYNNAEYLYIPGNSAQSGKLDVPPQNFVMRYIDTFIKNPVLMTRIFLTRMDEAWDIYPGEDTMVTLAGYTGTVDGHADWNDFYPKRKINSFTSRIYEMTSYTVTNQWINAIVWRGGLLFLLGMIALVTIALKSRWKICIAIYSPILGQLISLALSTGWPDFRYFWPLNLMNTCFVIIVLIILHKDCKV